MDFTQLDYLQTGTPLQRQAYDTLMQSGLLTVLQPFGPVLAGTLPLQLYIPGHSDLDILVQLPANISLTACLAPHFGHFPEYRYRQTTLQHHPTQIVNFILGDFPVEIFAQPQPATEQMAYRHLLAEYNLLQQHGDALYQQVLALKQAGLKTEPAFAQALGLTGDPYQSILRCQPTGWNHP